MSVRVGTGFDIHRLVPGRKLVLGGVEIVFDRGLEGHSDADVLTHAICDALLGAAALGDLGQHFPDSDPRFKNASSLDLLRRVHELVRLKGFRIGNVDATVMAESPRLAPYLDSMSRKLCETLEISSEQLNLKAKSHEQLDSIGRAEAIASQAAVLIETFL